jgi:hypothetical protein
MIKPDLKTCSANQAYWYVSQVIGDRWPEAESVIATDPLCAYLYATYYIRDRWIEAEQSIQRAFCATEYANRFILNKEERDKFISMAMLSRECLS